MKSLVSIHKSPKRDEMYLYVKKGTDLNNDLPEALTQVFGQPKHLFDLLLTPEKKLARVESVTVLEAIREKGFYLQMPPADSERDDYLITLPDEFLSINDAV